MEYTNGLHQNLIQTNTDLQETVRLAQLRYVSDDEPGIRREGSGDEVRYIDPQGKRITDKAVLKRIAEIGVPPGYTDVWICTDANGHIQATARDSRGRKQYRYHKRWLEVRDATKFARMEAFAAALPTIRAAVDKDLRRHGLPRERVLAAVVRLLETTFMRVGNDEYARTNKSYGATTLHTRHVEVEGNELSFAFRGKSKKFHTITLRDRRLANIIKRCLDLPGYRLFQYLDENDNRQTINAEDVNAYLRAITNQDFTAKDFRTWGGTVVAAQLLASYDPPKNEKEAKRKINDAVKETAATLGNTPTICRRCYIHPVVINAYQAGTFSDLYAVAQEEYTEDRNGLHSEEEAVLSLLHAANEAL
ncbi:MAG: DNA topoisomerase IB [Chloroflexaceae bacterium]|nr:DNA topoisomerase IB [Chloroflexaceae bacterium]